MYLPYDEKLKINPQDDSFLQKKSGMWVLMKFPKKNGLCLCIIILCSCIDTRYASRADTVAKHTSP